MFCSLYSPLSPLRPSDPSTPSVLSMALYPLYSALFPQQASVLTTALCPFYYLLSFLRPSLLYSHLSYLHPYVLSTAFFPHSIMLCTLYGPLSPLRPSLPFTALYPPLQYFILSLSSKLVCGSIPLLNKCHILIKIILFVLIRLQFTLCLASAHLICSGHNICRTEHPLCSAAPFRLLLLANRLIAPVVFR
jgi:hypothetical protein